MLSRFPSDLNDINILDHYFQSVCEHGLSYGPKLSTGASILINYFLNLSSFFSDIGVVIAIIIVVKLLQLHIYSDVGEIYVKYKYFHNYFNNFL